MAGDTILLVGPGAVGSFYSGKLAQSGAAVSVVCRSDYDVVKHQGIHVKSVDGDFHFVPRHVIKQSSEYQGVPDYIIVATKALPEVSIPDLIRDAVGPGTSIVVLQNGIDVELPVRAAFPDNEIISGLAFICVSRISPGHVEHQDYGRITIGTYPAGVSDKTLRLQRLFANAGISCQADENVTTARWKKLVWNAPFNPISVLGGGVNTRQMIDSGPTLHVVRKVMEEVLLLARSTGNPIDPGFIEKNLEDTYRMTPYKTSMLLDHENGRPMETEAILGNAIRRAVQLGIPVPYMQTLYGLLTLVDFNPNRKV